LRVLQRNLVRIFWLVRGRIFLQGFKGRKRLILRQKGLFVRFLACCRADYADFTGTYRLGPVMGVRKQPGRSRSEGVLAFCFVTFYSIMALTCG